MVQFYSAQELQKKHDEVFQSCPSPRRNDVPPTHNHEANFEAAFPEFAKVIGSENVIRGDDLVNFRDPYPLNPDAHQARAALW